MPLLDHFHDPLMRTHSWKAFHTTWAVVLVRRLNRLLPRRRFLAEPQINVGHQIEADVAELRLGPEAEGDGNGLADGSGGVAVLPYTAPPATARLPISFPDD